MPMEGVFMPYVGISCQILEFRYIFFECSAICSSPVLADAYLWISLGTVAKAWFANLILRIGINDVR